MKALSVLVGAAITCFRLPGPEADTVFTDVYDLRMSISVPRVYDNMESRGYRKIQKQKLEGKMIVEYSSRGEPSVYFKGVRNLTHSVGGEKVSYEDAECTDVRWHYIGNNQTGVFRKPSVSFSVSLWPDYNVSSDVLEDNSFVVWFVGDGSTSLSKSYRGVRGCQTLASLKGTVVGTLGCGCADYGHVSPTRIIGPLGATDQVVDVAAAHGTWTAKFNRKESGIKSR